MVDQQSGGASTLSTPPRPPDRSARGPTIIVDMPPAPPSALRLLTPAQAAEILTVTVEEIMSLVHDGQLRGMRVGAPAQWRIDEASLADYLDARAEIARRMALWEQSQEASFPELWGTGRVRHGD